MNFVITLSILIVCGIVNAIHHEELQSPPSFNRIKFKRSVFNGLPYAYGFHMPIEPMLPYSTYSHLEPHMNEYRPAVYWSAKQSSPLYWDTSYMAEFPRSSADPQNIVREHLQAPRSDVVYRTLMQRAAAAADADANVPNRGGNVAIQLTANLVYGYDEPRVLRPATRSARPGSFEFLQKSAEAVAEPTVIIVALSPDSLEKKDDTTTPKSSLDFDEFPLGPTTEYDVGYANAAAVTEDLYEVLWNKIAKLGESTVSESSEYAVTTAAAEVDSAENEINTEFYMTTEAVSANSKLQLSAISRGIDEDGERNSFYRIIPMAIDGMEEQVDTERNVGARPTTEVNPSENEINGYLSEHSTTKAVSAESESQESASVDENEDDDEERAASTTTEIPLVTVNATEELVDSEGNVGVWYAATPMLPTKSTTPVAEDDDDDDDDDDGDDNDNDDNSEWMMASTTEIESWDDYNTIYDNN